MFWLERLPNSVFTYSKYRNDNLPDLKMQLEVFFDNIYESLTQFETFLHGCLAFISAYVLK